MNSERISRPAATADNGLSQTEDNTRDQGLVGRGQVGRRSFLRGSALAVVGGGGVSAFLAACGGSGGSGPGSSSAGKPTNALKSIATLTYPMQADAGSADPDVYYGAEGVVLTWNCYDHLVIDTPVAASIPIPYESTTKFQPGLAHTWEVSPDGLTYTFHLRPGVKFSDGTPMNAAAWRECFTRRAKVNAGPAYMMQPVRSTEAPDDLTFVVHLKQVNNGFLAYMASPYGPQVISPTAIQKYQVNGDLAQKWLIGHSAGTGPYMLTGYQANTSYTLEANPHYWGNTPEVKKVNIPIVPSVEAQQIGFTSGQYDMVKGLSVQAYENFQSDPNYVVKYWQLAGTNGVEFNVAPGRVFANQELRKAAASAINKATLTKAAFKGFATVATQLFADGCFPPGMVPDNPPYNPALLNATVQKLGLSNTHVTIASGAFLGAPQQVLAELVQAEWQAAGLNATLIQLSWAQYQALSTTAMAKRPDVIIQGTGGDTVQVITGLKAGLNTGGSLNELSFSLPQGDKLTNEAIATVNPAAAVQKYAAAAKVYVDAGVIMSICSQPDIWAFRAGLSNFVHDPMGYNWLSLKDLKLAKV
ncbi:MAG: ABC transporter substrate-binding protein [Terriglobales bacterium]